MQLQVFYLKSERRFEGLIEDLHWDFFHDWSSFGVQFILGHDVDRCSVERSCEKTTTKAT